MRRPPDPRTRGGGDLDSHPRALHNAPDEQVKCTPRLRLVRPAPAPDDDVLGRAAPLARALARNLAAYEDRPDLVPALIDQAERVADLLRRAAS